MLARIIAALCILALAGVPGMAPAAWYEARTPHFVIYADNSPKALTDYGNRLERFDRAMHALTGLGDSPGDIANPVTIFVVPGTGAIEKLCRAGDAAATGCQGAAGLYQPHFGGAYAFTGRLTSGTGDDMSGQAVLFHEYAHHVMFGAAAAAYPIWYSEGFAEFWATAEPKPDGSVLVGKPPLYRAGGLVFGTLLPIETILTATVASLRGLEARSQLYGQSWLLVDYLTFDKARVGQMSRYLALVNAGESSLVAARHAFGDLKTLDRDLKNHIGARLQGVTLPADKIVIGAVTVRPLSAGETAMLPVRWRSKRGVNPATAPAVAMDARKIAAAFPNDPHVQDALAEAEYDAGADAAAEAAADRALAADPKDVTALLYKGRTRLRRALAGHAGDASVREARGWFVRANKLANNATLPLGLYYLSFVQGGTPPTANAIAGLVRANDLQPQDRQVRFMLVRQYLIDDKLKEARRTLAPLAFDPHAAADSAPVKLLAQIDAGDRTALKAWAQGAPSETEAPAGD